MGCYLGVKVAKGGNDMPRCTKGWCCCCVALADLEGVGTSQGTCVCGIDIISLTFRSYIHRVTYSGTLGGVAFDDLEDVPRQCCHFHRGYGQRSAAHMPGGCARSRSCRQGRSSKRKYKVERRKTSRHKPSKSLLVLLFLLFGLPFLWVRAQRAAGERSWSSCLIGEQLALMELCNKKRVALALEFTK
jgi:hypothetical protein